MFVSKYITIQIALFGSIGTGLLVSAEMSVPRTFSMDFIPRKKVVSTMYFASFSHPRRGANEVINPTFDIYEQHTQQILRAIRAGGAAKIKEKSEPGKVPSSSSSWQQSENVKNFCLVLTSTAALYGLFHTRSTWMSLFNKEKLQSSVVESLENLNSFPYVYSRSLYTLFMAIWECLGMSTIPVETAAGMVFGWSGFYYSGLGKLLGASLAFGLGRGALSSFVETKLSSNEFLGLVQTSTQDNPLLVVILMKLSCFPETVKNFGSSILKPIQWWMFLLGTSVHGLTFTALWTYLGVDTAAKLKDTEGLLPPDQRLKLLLTMALINGAVVSPLSMYYWIRTLKQKQKEAKGTVASRRRLKK